MLFWRKRSRPQSAAQPGFDTGLLALAIVRRSILCTIETEKFLQSQGEPELSPAAFTQTAVEFILLQFHETDRQAFNRLGVERRPKPLGLLLAAICECIAGDTPTSLSQKFHAQMPLGELSKVKPALGAKFSGEQLRFMAQVKCDVLTHEDVNRRNEEYGRMKYFPDKAEAQGGTLFWEFGKHVSEIVSGMPKDLRVILSAANAGAVMVQSFEEDVRTWLKGFAT